MKRSRSIKKYVESSESEDDKPLKRKSSSDEVLNNSKPNNESSSESDIEDYLLKPEKLNLDSHFFNTNSLELEEVEKKIFSGITRFSDSESETCGEEQMTIETGKPPLKPYSHIATSSKMNFKQLEDYTRKIEEAKKSIEIYKAKKAGENEVDIFNLLAAGERKLMQGMVQPLKPADLHSSDFESCDSEKEDWEEIKIKNIQESREKNLVPQSSLQITLDMPANVKKKKGIDLLAAMKRRLNRIRKENQVLVHKVHLLCWLAHGNYINSSINDTDALARALSLLPSEQCYPSDRIDLSYLEQIVNWYKRTVKNIDEPIPKDTTFDKCLQLQISKKEAYNQKMFVCVFIAILRALGIQTRIVMSLQVEPLRPPVSELHIVSSKPNENKTINQSSLNIKNSKKTTAVEQPKGRSTVVKHNKTEIAKPMKKHSTKDLDTSIKLKLKKGQISKSKAAKIPTTKRECNDVINEASCSKYLDGLNNKETIANIPINDLKVCEVIAGKNKRVNRPTKNQDKLLEVKTNPRKASALKIIENDKKNIPPAVKFKEFNDIKNSELEGCNSLSRTPIKQEIGKSAKSRERKDLELPRKSNIRNKKDTNRVYENYKTKQITNNNLKDLDSTKSKSPIQVVSSEKLSKNKVELKSSEGTIENAKSLDLHPNIPNTRSNRKRESKDSAASITNKAGRPKIIENENENRILRTTKRSIPQVDGIDDSYSDIESIIQLDGANDNQKQSNQSNIPSNSKICKKSSRNLRVRTKSPKAEMETDSESEFEPTSRSPVNRKRLSSNLKTCNLKKLTEIKSSPTKQLDVRNDIMNLIKGRISEQKQANRSRLAITGKRAIHSDSDSDYAPERIKKKYHGSDDDFVPKTKVKRRVQIPRKSIGPDSDNELRKIKKIGNDVWVEVFLEAEEKWISVDIIHGQVHCVKEIYQRASHPVSYIVSWDNNNKLKDVTQRYCQNFNTVTRKQRVDAKWWNESLKPFMGTPTANDKEEDDDLARQQLDQPLPKAIGEYKNHPLYALKRHLLKFEGLYPPEPPTLGFIRGEAVYPRHCIYTLHSRDIWLKQAKVVKLNEQPYKIVKARPKYDRLSNKVITDQTLEIFGPWQVQDYEPPTAENGIVPKNAFGNVDLFKSCMLPKGCVHLKLPGLNKIARKMNIDIASAIVGFDFHGGWSHPVYDGFVVCKEYEDQLISVWELEQDELERKEEEKIDKRVYGNWKKLIKGLLIRERLKAKYDFGKPSTSNVKDKRNKAKLVLGNK